MNEILQNMTLSGSISHNTMGIIDPQLASTIDPYRSYTARQIAELGFIKNIAGNAHDHKFILRQIKRGQLTAVDINSNGKRRVWQVSGQAIINYLQSH